MIAVLKLSPVFVLAALMISGFDALIAAPLATIVAALIAMWTEKKNFAYILDAAITNVREITIALFILMAAYALAETFMSTGVGASIINGIKLGDNRKDCCTYRSNSNFCIINSYRNKLGNICSLCTYLLMA